MPDQGPTTGYVFNGTRWVKPVDDAARRQAFVSHSRGLADKYGSAINGERDANSAGNATSLSGMQPTGSTPMNASLPPGAPPSALMPPGLGPSPDKIAGALGATNVTDPTKFMPSSPMPLPAPSLGSGGPPPIPPIGAAPGPMPPQGGPPPMPPGVSMPPTPLGPGLAGPPGAPPPGPMMPPPTAMPQPMGGPPTLPPGPPPGPPPMPPGAGAPPPPNGGPPGLGGPPPMGAAPGGPPGMGAPPASPEIIAQIMQTGLASTPEQAAQLLQAIQAKSSPGALSQGLNSYRP